MIRLCEPTFGGADRARVEAVLASGQLVQGEMVGAFEAALEAFLGVHVVACSNGTAALHIALSAVGIAAGDEVVMPAFTWPSAAHAIVQLGATPVFVDIDPDMLNFDPSRLEAAISDKTRALLPIHQFGIPAPMDEVMRVARAHGLAVVEDAACAIGSLCGDAFAGTIGDVGCLSFHPRKVLTTGEGGAIITRDAALAERARTWRNHGQDPGRGLERFVAPGLNFRMPELCAAIGIEQARNLAATLARRRALGARYVALLADVEGVRVPPGAADPAGNFQSFVVDVGSAETRAAVMERLSEAGVQTTIGTYAVTAQPIFVERGWSPDDTPHARDAMERLLTLPLHTAMADTDVDRVVIALSEALRGL